MISPFERLKERISQFGNHHRKYIQTIEKNHENLIERLEEFGKIGKVHLWKPTYDLSYEMDRIIEVSRNMDEKLNFLGTYYALQLLNMNLKSVDVLTLNLTSSTNRYDLFKEFMINTGNDFRRLTSIYMQKLFALFLEREKWPEFVICGVGTKADQDDIDIGIIDDGSDKRIEFNKAIGKLSNEMLKKASNLHMYLSEHVGSQSYSASIQEYSDLLDQEIHDFVIITEMLGAAPIFGNTELFNEFKEKVTNKYFFKDTLENKHHEGYLRGLIGEIRSLILRQMKPDSINPKDDGLRMIKSLLSVLKTIVNIDECGSWKIIEKLKEKKPKNREKYTILENSLSFLETFRYLYQLFEVQEEEILLGENNDRKNLQLVATTMGYEDLGVIKAYDHILVDYYNKISETKDVINDFFYDITTHLKANSIFAKLTIRGLLKSVDKNKDINLAEEYIKHFRFFKGTKFWDDLLEDMEMLDGQLLIDFISDFHAVPPERKNELINLYADWGVNAIYAMISFLVLISRYQNKTNHKDFFSILNEDFLKKLNCAPDVKTRLAKVFNHYPRLFNNYLMAIPEDAQELFTCLLEGNAWEKEIDILLNRLVNLCNLHFNSSRYFKRFFIRIIDKYPEFIEYLDNTDKLKQIAKGIYAKIENLPLTGERKQHLGDYYDIEFLRVGLETLQGASIKETNLNFTEFCDNYIQGLFEICKREVDSELGKDVETKDLFAIFTAGGHAREQAFDDDYDLIAILNSNDEEIIKYTNKIITRMNTEIIKRGTLPHYRFADHFGNYVTLMDQLKELFEEGNNNIFIDKSQILGSRLVVGSTKFEKDFINSIIKPYIYDTCDSYARDMLNEIESRHKDRRNLKSELPNIKEGIGGLRDIESVFLIYKAVLKLREPISYRLIEKISSLNPENSENVHKLERSLDFLKSMRDVYRLTSSAEDTLHIDYLENTAKILGYTDKDGNGEVQKLLNDFYKCTEEVNNIIIETKKTLTC